MKCSDKRLKDMDEISKDLKKLDRNGRAIAASVVACLLERQQMDEQKEAG